MNLLDTQQNLLNKEIERKIMMNIAIAALCIISLIVSGQAEYRLLFAVSNIALVSFVLFKTVLFIAVLNKKEVFNFKLGNKNIDVKVISNMDLPEERSSECRMNISLTLIGIMMICGEHMWVGVPLATSSIFILIKILAFERHLAKG